MPLNIAGLFTGRDDGSCLGSHGRLKGTVWDLIPGVKETMFSHQCKAFEFMWRNLAGSIHLDKLKSSVGSDGTGGCVISHAPGTGKTRLAIVFIQSYMKAFPDCRPVIVAHRGLMQTWKSEFRKWGVHLSVHDLNASEYSGQEDMMTLELERRAAQSHNKDMRLMRLVKLYSWDKGNGVILMGYQLFARIYSDNDLRSSWLKKILLEKPGLIIFDEGHTPRNERSLIWKALEDIRTPKRVILSGTPFQNNFTELFNTLCLVRPKFAEKISTRTSTLGQTKREEFFATKDETLPERREAKSRWDYLTKYVSVDGRELKSSIEEVKSVIKPFVHVHSGKILDTLPGLRKCILVLNPLPHQKMILDKMTAIKSSSSLENDYRNSLVSIHPSLALTFLSEKEQALIGMPMLEQLKMNPNEGVKTKLVIELIRLCIALKEKVLVFCQYIDPLDMIRDQLVKKFGWTDGKEVLKMDGQILSKNRQSLINAFNDLSSESRVLLASTKACSEGISLVGASRVVLVDVLWNPAMEQQAISRAYRIGQTKFVYVYQLVTFGTGERNKYGAQATKDKISKLVFSPGFDVKNIEPFQKEETSKLIAEDQILQEMTGHATLKDVFQNIYYPVRDSNTNVFNEEDSNTADNGHC